MADPRAVDIDTSDLPDDVHESAQKLADYSYAHDMPRGKDAWFELASKIGIPQDHLEQILGAFGISRSR